MKRVGNLFEQMCSIENIRAAHAAARKGKRHYREVKQVEAAPDKHFEKLRAMLIAGEYKTAPYVPMTKRCSGKTREILKLPYFPDRIVHHCIVQVLAKTWDRSMIRDTYACIPGRGIHDGVRRIKEALLDRAGTRYCLKMDVEKFYPSVDHDILKRILRRKIKDNQVLALLDEIIDSTERGVPIGNYLSQHFGNLYLSGYDHWMKEQMRCRHYFRYCDDVVILDGDKGRLHELRVLTQQYWRENLNLRLKSNWQVFPVDARGLDFLGYRFFHGYTLLRKSIAARAKRRARRIKRSWPEMRPVSVVSSVSSYDGWMKHANCRNLRRSIFDDEMARIVSAVAKTDPKRKAAA